MDKVKLWLSAFRLRTLPLSVSGIIIGSCFAFYNGFFKVSIFIFAILTTLSLQILSNLANDYGDGIKGTDNDDRIGPERAIQSGKITPEDMFLAIRANILIVILLVFLLVLSAFGTKHFLYALLFFALGGLCIYAAIRYTVGSSAYGYRALGDIMVFIFFGLLSVGGSYFLYARQLDHVIFLPACVVGLLSTGVLNLNNMRDIRSDLLSNKITVAVRLGFERAKRYHIILISLAIILSTLFGLLYYTAPLNLVYIIFYIPLVKHVKFVHRTEAPKQLDSQLKVLALSTFLLSTVLGLGYLQNAI